jgi:hypothetical protein
VEAEELGAYRLALPAWRCQPYVRPPPEQFIAKMKKIQEETALNRWVEGKIEEIICCIRAHFVCFLYFWVKKYFSPVERSFLTKRS